MLSRWSPWYGTSSQVLLWSNMRAMPFVFPQPHGYREREMSVGASCGLLLTKGSLPPSLLPLPELCNFHYGPCREQWPLPTESELNHCPTLSTRGPRAAGDAALVAVEAESVSMWGWMGDVVTWHIVVACRCVALRCSRGWGGR